MNTHIWTAVTDDWLPLWDLVRPNWEEYCERHGYYLHVQREFDASMPFTFAKIKAAHQHLSYLFSDMFILDADIVFTNMAIPIDSLGGNNYISITRDINGLNSGVLRVCADATPPNVWMNSIVAMRTVCTSEQHAIQILDEAYADYTEYLPHPSFNSIVLDEYPDYAGKYTEADGNWAPGHLLAHFPGMSLQQRLTLIPKYLAQVQR